MSFFRFCLFCSVVVTFAAQVSANDANSLKISAGPGQDSVLLIGPGARQQIQVSRGPTSKALDVTRQAELTIEPSGIATISETGYLQPLANGAAKLTVTLDGRSASMPIRVAHFESPRPISFPNDIVPILTRSGCNSGACHGTPAGKNNFRLSLLGYEPETDFEFLTKESRGRRVAPTVPDKSFMLLKASGQTPHGGGIRIKKGSEAYKTVRRWIQTGLSYGPEGDPTVERIEITPKHRVVAQNAAQQLTVTAFFSDGTARDITRVADYKANQAEMCSVDHHGLVQMRDYTGAASVMVRFQEHVGVFMATIPLGKPTPNLPKSKSFIDDEVFAQLETLGLPPSKTCDDSFFIRRISIDLAGRLPTIEETKTFLASKSPTKRADHIETLLQSTAYADLFANKWCSVLRNKGHGDLEQVARETSAFHAWIRASLNANKPFDQIVRELLTAQGKSATNPAVSWYRAVKDPKDRMADIAQVFLGVRIRCAQCHHHPYEKWTQDDYYGFAAFFSTIGKKEVAKLPEDDIYYHTRILAKAKNPASGLELKPTPLDGEPLEIPAERDPRVALADWISSPANPFFAKMLVNRYWKHFFGRGLVEPEDDIRVTNPATHPALLDKLAKAFTESEYDLKQLCRLICNSQTYQRDCTPNEVNGEDDQNYARFYPRRFSAEVMLDAINDMAGAQNNFKWQPRGVRAIELPDDSSNRHSEFLRIFGRPSMDTACECERSETADLTQSLHLINSNIMNSILGTPGGTADRYSRDAETDQAELINNIFLHGYSRKPTEAEFQIANKHLAKQRDLAKEPKNQTTEQKALKQGYEDVIWVLINSKEFLFNH